MKNHLGKEIKLPRNTILIGSDFAINLWDWENDFFITDLDEEVLRIHHSGYPAFVRRIDVESGIYKTQNKELLEYLSKGIKSDIIYIRIEEHGEKLKLVEYTPEQLKIALENNSEVRGY